MNVQLIQWIVLGACAVFALLRLPDAVRGQGRAVFAAVALMVVAVALSLPQIYLPVDDVLGGVNLANLLLRLCLFAIFVLLGVRMAGAFRSPRSRWLIVGPPGLVVLGVVGFATFVLFLLSDLPYSSTGLVDYGDQAMVELYGQVGRTYPGYVAACLVIPAVKGALDSSARFAHRGASALLALGFATVVAFAVLRLAMGHLGVLEIGLPFGAILLVVFGLTIIWASRRRTERSPRGNLLA